MRGQKQKKPNKRYQFLALTLVLFFVVVVFCSCQTSKAAQEQLEYRQTGIDLMDAGEYDTAIKTFDLALSKSVGRITDVEIDICYYKAAAQYQAGDIDGAIETYSALIGYKPKTADAYFLRGTMYLAQQQKEAADADFNQMLSLNQYSCESYLRVYEAYTQAGYEDEAALLVQSVADGTASADASDSQMGYIYYLAGEYEKAKESFSDAVSKNDIRGILCLVDIAAAEEDYETALTLVNEVLSQGTDDGEENEYEQEFRFNEAVLYEYMGDYEKALSLFTDYVKAYPDDEAAQKEVTFLTTRTATDTAETEASGEATEPE
jgi:tetratricopeptide (TPR) repeat protein